MKKFRSFVLAVVSFTLVFSITFAKASNAETVFNTENVNKGVVTVNYSSTNDKKIKLLVEKDGKQYSYTLTGKTQESFPLQMGNGTYKVSVLENVSGNSYKVVNQSSVDVNIENEKNIYLNSIQNINWNDSMAVVKLANQLTKNAKSKDEKVKILYNYVVNNIKYDYVKLNNVQAGYIPSIDSTLSSKKGICYDYSSMLAAMLRSQGIPTKLVMGYTSNVKGYHAWNEIYMESSKKWIVVDSTYDSQVKGKVKVTMEKKASLYQMSKVY
jgi:hypothetical protein